MVVPVLALAACGTHQSLLPNINFSNIGGLGWQSRDASQTLVSVKMPTKLGRLAQGNKVEMRIYNAIELVRKKRFDEALDLMSSVRAQLEPRGDGYLAVACSMTLIALRSGDIGKFKENAQVLDVALGEPINVPKNFVEVISLYRAMTGKMMPVNTPDDIQKIKDQRSHKVIARAN